MAKRIINSPTRNLGKELSMEKQKAQDTKKGSLDSDHDTTNSVSTSNYSSLVNLSISSASSSVTSSSSNATILADLITARVQQRAGARYSSSSKSTLSSYSSHLPVVKHTKY